MEETPDRKIDPNEAEESGHDKNGISAHLLLSRRGMISSMAALSVGILASGCVPWYIYPGPNSDPCGDNPENGVEFLKDLPGLEAVLAASLSARDRNGKTIRDNLLSPYGVLKYFLDEKFWYTGQSEKVGGLRIHRFAVIGDRSRYRSLDKKGWQANSALTQEKLRELETLGGYGYINSEAFKRLIERANSTTLPDAINTLLDYERVDDGDIRSWIAFTYSVSFGVNLSPEKILLERDPRTKKIVDVRYTPQEGFEKHVVIRLPKEIKGIPANAFQGNLTTEIKYVPVLDSNNRILLLSGVSPDHDLQIPNALLNHSKKFKMKVGEGAEWELDAAVLAESIHWYEEVVRTKGRPTNQFMNNGKLQEMRSLAPFIPLESGEMKGLAEFLTKNVKGQQSEIRKLTTFVQSLPYISENAEDFDRPPMITLFNGGGDCNNLVILWSALMAAKGHEHAIVYIPAEELSTDSHVMGGVPKANFKTAGDRPTWHIDDYWLTELTGRFPIGEVPKKEIKISAIETIKMVNGEMAIEKIK